MKEKPDYTTAFAELQTIIAEIEVGSISVDKLAEKVKRAAILIRICQDKLHATEGDVNQIFAELESPAEPASSKDTQSGRGRVSDAGDVAGD